MTAAPLVVRVQTPEKGRYSVRCPDGFVARHGGRVVVKLDYGLDIAEVVDERVHSDASPAFSIVRLTTRLSWNSPQTLKISRKASLAN